jgi:hypothetical protein
MSAAVDVTPDHMARAYAQMRKPGMPSLDELRDHWVLYSCIRNRALGIARGQALPPEPAAASPPVQTPAPPPAYRRRDDTPPRFDPRAAAAGEYVHPDE